MILVPCPHCGPRNASEFHWKGEVRERPDPSTATPAQWRHYLYVRRNVAGWNVEKWFHHAGCGRYFTLERHTVTNRFRSISPEATAEESSAQPDSASVRDREAPTATHGGK
jgi:heterotetrameric sarcosine oxidase delta subunit